MTNQERIQEDHFAIARFMNVALTLKASVKDPAHQLMTQQLIDEFRSFVQLQAMHWEYAIALDNAEAKT